jgi:hypothetical protein
MNPKFLKAKLKLVGLFTGKRKAVGVGGVKEKVSAEQGTRRNIMEKVAHNPPPTTEIGSTATNAAPGKPTEKELCGEMKKMSLILILARKFNCFFLNR